MVKYRLPVLTNKNILIMDFIGDVLILQLICNIFPT